MNDLTNVSTAQRHLQVWVTLRTINEGIYNKGTPLLYIYDLDPIAAAPASCHIIGGINCYPTLKLRMVESFNLAQLNYSLKILTTVQKRFRLRTKAL